MANPTVSLLIEQVRRRLWRAELWRGVRHASWCTVFLTILATAVHFAWRPVRTEFLVTAIAVVWVVVTVRTGWRRPSDAACALWADQFLDGESAYSTLVETRVAPTPSHDACALRWLQEWAMARVPASLQLLAVRAVDVRAWGALLSSAACAAVGALALSLPPRSASHAPDAIDGTSAGIVNRQAQTTQASAGLSDLVSELANASRSAEPDSPSNRRAEGPARAQPSARAADAPTRTSRDGNSASATDFASRPAASDTSVERASATAGSSRGGSGRDAGETHDNRTDVGASRASQDRLAMRVRESSGRDRSDPRADSNEAAAFADEPTTGQPAATVPAVRAPAALARAADPNDAPLGPTTTMYVQTWMKATRKPH